MISYASSSFIEEEHQTWYYLVTTLLIAFYVMDSRHTWQTIAPANKPIRFAKRTNANTPTLIDFLSGKEVINRFVWCHITWIHLLLLHLFARRLNQTGDKWISVPDIGDWLVMDENRLWQSCFVAASLFLMVIHCSEYGSLLTNVLAVTAAILVYYYRILTKSVYFAGIQSTG